MQLTTDHLELFIKIGAALAALGSIYKFIWRPFKTKILDRLNFFYNKVNYITAELTPNGGNSLRDQINYIKRSVDRIDHRQLNFFHFDLHGIIETDAVGNLVWANRAYLDMVKRHPEEIQNQGWRNVIEDLDRERVVREWENAVKDKRDFFSRFNLQDSSGNVFKVESRCLAMRDSNNTLLGHLGFVTRLDQPPPGCRWCRDVEILSDEVAKLISQAKSQQSSHTTTIPRL